MRKCCHNCRELWKDIPGYEGFYAVSTCGRLKSLRSGRILRQIPYRGGYVQTGLSVRGKQKMMKVHRAVALAFIENPEGKPQVNHLDEDKTNNCVFNLEWATPKENVHHGTCIERGKRTQGRPIVQIRMDGTTVRVWPYSTLLVSAGFNRHSVWCCCTGKWKQHKGFRWKYADEVGVIV